MKFIVIKLPIMRSLSQSKKKINCFLNFLFLINDLLLEKKANPSTYIRIHDRRRFFRRRRLEKRSKKPYNKYLASFFTASEMLSH